MHDRLLGYYKLPKVCKPECELEILCVLITLEIIIRDTLNTNIDIYVLILRTITLKINLT